MLLFNGLLGGATYGQSSVEPPVFGTNQAPPQLDSTLFTRAKAGRPRTPEPTSLSDLFPTTDVPHISLMPLLENAVRVPNLGQSAIYKLANNYFVIVNDARIADFADLYRQNRADNKPNFVTIDCIMHPWLAHRNAIKIAVLKNFCIPQLMALLNGMIAASTADYYETEDSSVKDDIQRNLAYLSVAVKLLDPGFKLKELGGANELVQQELTCVEKGERAQSVLFRREEDYSLFHPFGWYDSETALKNYFRCRQWLGRMYFCLTDVTNDSLSGNGNEFRRAILLYRSLVHTKLTANDGLTSWAKLHQVLAIVEDGQGHPCAGDLLPTQLQTTFPTSDSDLKVTLHALSEPLARTKLLLSLKSKERKELGSASIFELDAKERKNNEYNFRLFPEANPPECDWLSSQVVRERAGQDGFNEWPSALLFLHARGAHVATNILAESTETLDSHLITALPMLNKMVAAESQKQQSESIWPILNVYLKPLPEKAQPSLRTYMWLTHGLESTISCWLDSLLASGTSLHHELNQKQTSQSVAGTTNTPSPPARIAFHYLEPVQDLFTKMGNSLRRLESSLATLNLFPPELKERTDDFNRLTDRLAKIARRELENAPMESNDAQLLANIDTVLEKISTPLAGNLYISYAKPSMEAPPSMLDKKVKASASRGTRGSMQRPADSPHPSLSKFSGINLGLGRPATLYIFLPAARGAKLYRGAVYSFYETPGDPISAAHWQRQLDYGLVKPPLWCDSFQLVDESTTKH